MHGNLGCIGVKRGVSGCRWVRMGALGSRGTVGHKNNACRDKNGRAGPDLGPMAGEISPNIMFCKKRAKGVRTAPHGCTWVRMGAVVCICNGNEAKIRHQNMF